MNNILTIFCNGVEANVPQAEALVLKTLSELGQANGAEIARATDKISAAAVYALLSRLNRRELVRREDDWIETESGIPVRRVTYRAVQGIRIEEKEIETKPRNDKTITSSRDKHLKPQPS